MNLEYGSGLNGFIGRLLAIKMGLPIHSGKVDFEVNISHADGVLLWNRQFGKKHKLSSIFTPHGYYPNGYWYETNGKLSFQLGVDIHKGGWYWIQQKVRFMNITLPLYIFPSTQRYKRCRLDYREQASLLLMLSDQLMLQ